ncbi:hypothetical protein DFP72DRAFT_1076898 [Ephemerocybe angulata]|uniref:Uncharacterized protein n=1 Tax=Ephemerocybe angulata TaxID=980116 RepID=A0A8H6HF98_9AGAR|nr:hypothetical protein DFP72DRAFT_1076898 [Tulosesus angulatus]
MAPDDPTYDIPRRAFRLVLVYCTLRELEIFSDLPAAGEMSRLELTQRVDSLLEENGLPPEMTLRRMREGNVVFTGARILRVLLPGCNVDDTLSFCCPGWGRDSFLQFLLLSGYRVESEDDQTVEDEDYGRQRSHSGCRHGMLLVNGDGCSITVLESVSMSPLVPVFFSPTTASMNYISADGVACLYPDTTLNKTGLTNYARYLSDEERRRRLEPYIAQGFQVIDSCEVWHSHGSADGGYTQADLPVHCQRKSRRIDRPDALMVPFAKGGFVPVRPFARWRLGHNRLSHSGSHEEKDVLVSVEAEGGSFIEYNLHQKTFELEDLLYGYLVAQLDEL